MNTKYVMGIDPISSEGSSKGVIVHTVKRGNTVQTINPEKVNGTFPEGIVTEECELSHLTKEQLKNLLDSAYPKITTPAREIHLTTAYRGKAHQQFIESMASECAKKTLHYQQMEPKYMFPYDVEELKQKLWDEMTDETKAMYMAIKTLTLKKLKNERNSN